MNVAFQVSALSIEQVPLTYPLIQAIWPGIALPAWEEYAAHLLAEDNDNGAICLWDNAGCVCGLAAYRPDRDLLVGPVLATHLFAVVDLANSLRTVRALLDAVDTRAYELGCTNLHLRLHSGQSMLASRLNTLGLAFEAGLLSQPVSSKPPQN